MRNWSDLRIGVKLATGFSVVLVLLLAVVVIAKMALANIESSLDLVISDRYAKVKLVGEINEAVNQQARSTRNMLIMDSAAEREGEARTVMASRDKIGKSYDKLQALLNTEEGKRSFAELMQRRQAYVAELDGFLQLMAANNIAAARSKLLQDVRPRQLDYMKKLEEFQAFEEKLMDEASAQARKEVNTSSMVMLVAAALALVVGIAAAFAVTRSIVAPVREAVAALKEVGDGNLTVSVRSDRRDELGELLQALGRTVESLQKVVTQVRRGVDSVSTASSQIAAGNQDLSSRTEEQASSLQQTAASMEQLTSTVRQSADNARQANQLAAAASTSAEKGGTVVGQVVTTMDAITHSSRKISEIIGVIDGIAFQTNILALNAAVEAARAGEQGRGFAVVAGEVRTLAQRSAQAAREIKSLISESVERVNTGSQQVADAGAAMTEIVAQVRRVTDLIGEITSASAEQASGINQINEAVTQMDQVTQQNAALVEESAAAAQSLREQAAQLSAAVAAFRLQRDPLAA